MSNEYLYGAYGHIGETTARSAVQAGTVPVYIGIAPVNLVRGFATKGIINAPVKVSNMPDAQNQLGYSKDWAGFTLCEAFAAHFNNPLGNIGPIYVINVLDPATMKSALPKTVNLVFKAGRAEFESDKIILDTFDIADKAEGTDFAISYNFNKGTVVITSVDPDAPLTGTIEATYSEVDLTAIDAADIIGGITADGIYTGLGALALLYQEQNAVANILAAPGWSEKPTVYNALVSAAQKINGHWDAFVVADIPIFDVSAVDTIDKAIAWKDANGYISERSKAYWPQAINGQGEKFHLSTLAVATMQRTDYSHDSIPMETPGNKAVGITKLFFGDISRNRGYDQQTANGLTQKGICTAVYWGGQWVLWGDHTAAYSYGADVDPRAIFDVSIRMLMHITNSFQREWGTSIDEPMSIQMKDTILNREQEKLDSLLGIGALIGKPKVEFIETANPVTNIMNGDFRWDIAVTPTPPLKSASAYVTYTDEGFAAYFGGEQ
jgi:phage tail sheath protein FI